MTKLDVITEFRNDHRKVRDSLLELIDVLKAKDVAKAKEILGNLNTMVGPHFRFEEEHLYLTLKVFLGEYVDQLISEHDGIIDTARACADLLEKDSISDEEGEQAAEAARKLLIHVSNCDGLAILAERLSPQELDELGEDLATARDKNVSLLDWAEKIRKK
ncbi:MAG: hemerythrin domain-containing protein [Candidatus Omnitrophota bacterium]